MSYLGIDIGTTGAKALLINEQGSVLGKGYASYRLLTDGCKIEQRADDWTQCSASAIRQAIQNHDPASIAAISLSTQGASTVAIDAQRNPIGNALTWMDTRAKAEAIQLEESLGANYIYRSTGWRVNPALDAAKIMHIKQDASYQNVSLFLLTLEYMNLFLTGNPVCDPSNASIRQLYNISQQDYDQKILDAANIKRSELPEVLPTGSFVGYVTATAAGASGLKAGTPVYNGAHDQYCASLGAGAIEKGDMLLSAGTTWVIMGINDSPLFTNTYIAPGVHPMPGLYGAIASLVGCGSSFQWFKNEFLSDDFKEIDLQSELRTDRGQDLFFFPFLSGAYYPEWNLKAKGTFSGISLDHDRFDFSRSIMESSAFAVRQALDDFAANNCHISRLKMMGGAAKSDFWCKLISSASNVPVEISNESDACALGAAMIAASGVGAFDSLQDAVRAMSGESSLMLPDPTLVAILTEKYTRYRHMWHCIAQYYV